MHEIDTGRLDASYCARLYHPKVYSDSAQQLWLAMLAYERPTHVAISSTYDSWHVALELAGIVRRVLPEAIVIQGGPHLDEVLEPFVIARTPELDPLPSDLRHTVDFAVGGDGEHALLWLVKQTLGVCGPDEAKRIVASHTELATTLPGTGNIVFFAGDRRFQLRFRNPMPLDSLPYVPRHLLPIDDMYDFDCFRDGTGRRRPTVTMITHRGCRARCNFCSEGLPYQARSHANILDEAAALREQGVEAIFLDDSTVHDDPELLHLMEGFSSLGLEVGALTRFDQIQDLETLRYMRRLGLVYLYASVEQYSDDSLDLMHKRQHVEEIDRGVRNCELAGVRLGVSLLFGLPYETRTGVSSTLDYAARLRDKDQVEYISMSMFSYHPKTPLGQMRRDRLKSFDFNHHPPNLHYPFTGFEEGSWYHAEHVSNEYAAALLDDARERFGDRLVREMARHRGDLGMTVQ